MPTNAWPSFDYGIPIHMRDIPVDLQGLDGHHMSRVKPSPNSPTCFPKSSTDFDSCSLLPSKVSVPPTAPRLRLARIVLTLLRPKM